MVSPLDANTSLSSLPDEVLVEVLQYLPFDALQKMRITDKRFYGLISGTPVTLLRAMDISQDPRVALLGVKTLGKVESLVAKFLELTGMDKWEMHRWNWEALLSGSRYDLNNSNYIPHPMGTPTADVRSLKLGQLYYRLQFFNEEVHFSSMIFHYFYPNASSNRDLALAVVKRKGSALEDVDPSLKKDFEIVLAAVTEAGLNIRFADPSLRSNDTILKVAISNYGPALSYGNSAQKKDPEFVIPAVVEFSYALEEADSSLQDDELIVRIAMLKTLDAIRYASPRLQQKLKIDKSMYSDFVRESMQYFQQVDFPLINNKSFVLKLIEITGGLVFEYLDPSQQDDEALLKAALIKNEFAASFASDRLKQKYTKDKKAVLDTISKNCWLFRAIDPFLQDDEEVLEAALSNISRHDSLKFGRTAVSDRILKSASDRLQKKYNNRK